MTNFSKGLTPRTVNRVLQACTDPCCLKWFAAVSDFMVMHTYEKRCDYKNSHAAFYIEISVDMRYDIGSTA